MDALEELLEEIANASLEKPVLVEGAKDERALRELGVSGTIVRLNRGTSLFGVCELVASRHREAIVLTDWDAKGGQLARIVADALLACGSKPDSDYRRALAREVRREVHQVESLPKFLDRLRTNAREEAGNRRLP